jgi:hypothetical protein
MPSGRRRRCCARLVLRMDNGRWRFLRALSTIHGKRLLQSWPFRVSRRTRSPSRVTIRRSPSYLTLRETREGLRRPPCR